MIKKDQNIYYKILAHRLTEARKSRKISIAQLSRLSGEQHKTLRDMESAQFRCSLHHAVWMKNILGIDLNSIIRDFNEGIYEHAEPVHIGNIYTDLVNVSKLDDLI